MKLSNNFYPWLVGFWDGDGSFSVIKQKNSWNLCFQISQSTYNIKLLYYIKEMLGVGSIKIEKNRNLVTFRIRDRKNIQEIILPIFEKYPLLSSKNLDYLVFKESCLILENMNLTQEKKNLLIISLKKNLNLLKKDLLNSNTPGLKPLFQTDNIYMSDDWLVGFWEAEGSFYILKKDENRYVHAAGLTQKLDNFILEIIRQKFKIVSKVRYREKYNFYILETTNSRSIENIISFFSKKLKGVKSLEFKIWSRTLKFKKDKIKILKVQKLLQKIRSFRPNNDEI